MDNFKKTKSKKVKVPTKTNPLEEARTIGYIEGFSDGRNNLIEELVEHKLLIRGWKKIYNEKNKEKHFIK